MTLPIPQPDPRARAKEDASLRKHQARVLALQVLYEIDMTHHPVEDVLPRTLEEQDATVAISQHVTRLVDGVLANLAIIDEYIGIAAPAFPVEQLPLVDRNVLRMATYELMFEPAVPPKAAINEAVEISKRFGGPNSSRFVNGALRTILERVVDNRPESPAEDGPTDG
jgi:transcription antitermination protein NusB